MRTREVLMPGKQAIMNLKKQINSIRDNRKKQKQKQNEKKHTTKSQEPFPMWSIKKRERE